MSRGIFLAIFRRLGFAIKNVSGLMIFGSFGFGFPYKSLKLIWRFLVSFTLYKLKFKVYKNVVNCEICNNVGNFYEIDYMYI